MARCMETTLTVDSRVQCRKEMHHDAAHWALQSGGRDVVWLVTILRTKAKAS